MDTQRRTMLTVGERLHIARTRADVGVGEMAGHLDRHRNRVTAYENAGDDVPLWVVRKYAEILPNETTVEWLTAEAGEAPRHMAGAVTLRNLHGVTQHPLWEPYDEPVAPVIDLPTPGVVSGRATVTGLLQAAGQ